MFSKSSSSSFSISSIVLLVSEFAIAAWSSGSETAGLGSDFSTAGGGSDLATGGGVSNFSADLGGVFCEERNEVMIYYN